MAQLAVHGLPLLQALLLDDPTNWLQQVVRDIALVQLHMAPKLSSLPSPQHDLQPWIALWYTYPQAWKSILAAYAKIHH